MNKRQNGLFRGHDLRGGGLYTVLLMSAEVLLMCTEWGTTKQCAQTDSRVETYLAPHFFHSSRTQNQLFLHFQPCICFLSLLRSALERLKTHANTSVLNFWSAISKSRPKCIYWRPICLCLVSVLTVGPNSSDNRYNWHVEKGTRRHLTLDRYWKESFVALDWTSAPFFSLL